MWQLELAVMLTHLGYVGMSPELLERAHAGKPLNPGESALLAGAPKTAHNLMADVPRIEVVLGIIDKLADAPPALAGLTPNTKVGRLPWAAHIIISAMRADQLSHTQPIAQLVADTLASEGYNPLIIDAIREASFHQQKRQIAKVTAQELETGMFLMEDALSNAGVLMAKGDQEVTPTVAVLLRRVAARQNLKEPLTVSVQVS